MNCTRPRARHPPRGRARGHAGDSQGHQGQRRKGRSPPACSTRLTHGRQTVRQCRCQVPSEVRSSPGSGASPCGFSVCFLGAQWELLQAEPPRSWQSPCSAQEQHRWIRIDPPGGGTTSRVAAVPTASVAFVLMTKADPACERDEPVCAGTRPLDRGSPSALP